MLLMAATLAGVGACRRRPPKVIKPVQVSGSVTAPETHPPTPSPRGYGENAPEAIALPSAPAPVRPATRAPAAPATPVPTASAPYQASPDGTHVPMWRQRAKFY
jgi:hypothetical protein